MELVDVIEPDRHLQAEALALACHLDNPVYDCLYLALARRAGYAGAPLNVSFMPPTPLHDRFRRSDPHAGTGKNEDNDPSIFRLPIRYT